MERAGFVADFVIASWRCISWGAFIRFLQIALSDSDYRIEAHVRDEELERLRLELDSMRGMGRLKVKVIDDKAEQKGKKARQDGEGSRLGSSSGSV